MKKVLPISFYKPIETECWTRFRTSIISAYPELSYWFINHLNSLYINNHFEVNYGEYEGKYQTHAHYEAVLNTYNRNLKNLTCENIVEYLIEQINNEKYILIELDTSKLYEYIKETYFAETIIYGYDTNNETFFSEKNFSFKQLIEAFRIRKELNCNDREKNFRFRQNWYPINLLEVRKDYKAELDLQLFYNSLVRHKLRRHFDITHDTEEFTSIFWEGICSVYEGFLELLIRINEGKFDVTKMFHSFPYNYKKLLEFNNIFKWKLEILDRYFNLYIPNNIYEAMDKIIGKLVICKNLANKYLEKKDNKIINKIYILTDEILQTEENVLEQLMDIIMKKILYY